MIRKDHILLCSAGYGVGLAWGRGIKYSNGNGKFFGDAMSKDL